MNVELAGFTGSGDAKFDWEVVCWLAAVRGDLTVGDEMTTRQMLELAPELCAHVICHSLGYATPIVAASIVLAAARGRPHFCEWIASCYRGEPRMAVAAAVRTWQSHRGYMADFDQAMALVLAELSGCGPMFASWF